MIDRQKLLNEVDTLTVANYIGMEVKHRGKNNYIRCPGHIYRLGKEDKKISNAVLTQHGYHCYSCDATVNAFDMVKEFLHCDFSTALKTVADAMGGESNYTTTYKNNTKNSGNTLSLSQEELSLLGIKPGIKMNFPVAVIQECDFFKTCNDFYVDVAENSINKTSEYMSICNFKESHPKIFRQMILDIIDEMINNYQEKIQKYTNRDSEEFAKTYALLNVDGMIDEGDLSSLKNVFLSKIYSLKELREKVIGTR